MISDCGQLRNFISQKQVAKTAVSLYVPEACHILEVSHSFIIRSLKKMLNVIIFGTLNQLIAIFFQYELNKCDFRTWDMCSKRISVQVATLLFDMCYLSILMCQLT